MKQTRRKLWNDLLFALALVATFSALQWWQPAWLSRIEGIFYDFKLTQLTKERPPSPVNIQIIDFDEKSLEEIGRWPWPRKHLATLVDQLTASGAIVIAFDVLFSEPQNNPADIVSETLKSRSLTYDLSSIKQLLDDDMIFSQANKNSEVVLGSLFLYGRKKSKGTIKAPSIIQPSNDIQHDLHEFEGYNASIDLLNNSAQGQGFLNSISDGDGFIRRAALLCGYQGKLYPSLALETFRVYSFVESITPQWHETENITLLSGINIGKEFIATDNKAQILVPYRGGIKTYPYTSASDVILQTKPNPDFDGAVVFVGTSAVGLADLRSTPVALAYPGIEVHANIFDSLTQPHLQPLKPDWWLGGNIVLITIIGLFLTLILRNMTAAYMTTTSISLFFLIWGINTYLWYEYYLHLPIVLILALIITIAFSSLIQGFFRENVQRKKVKAMFDQYVPPQHIDKLLDEPNNASLSGDRKEMSVLFADIRSFTKISEGLSANDLKQLLNEYLSPVTEAIFDHQGTIDKYVGDMVMAFWGAPVNNLQHAKCGIDGAFEMLKVTEELSEKFVEKGWPAINIGIGINSGDMNVGDMGSEYRRAYTVLGDAVNLGSRLESITKFYGVNFLVSEFTKEMAPEYRYQIIDKVKVVGKEEAVAIYLPINHSENDKQWQQADLFNQLFEVMQAREFNTALTMLSELQLQYGHSTLYSLYEERIKQYQLKPPEHDWDGSFTHHSK